MNYLFGVLNFLILSVFVCVASGNGRVPMLVQRTVEQETVIEQNTLEAIVGPLIVQQIPKILKQDATPVEPNQKPVEIMPTIIGGHEAKPHSAPYIVSIAVNVSPTEIPQHFCGGSILSTVWVLSAAHCMNDADISKLVVIAGEHNRTFDYPNYRQYRSISVSIVHEKWDLMSKDLAHDMSLNKMKLPFDLNQFVATINLPNYGDIPFGKSATYGWGRINNESPPVLSDVLKTVTLNVLKFEECKKVVQKFQYIMDPSNICTSSIGGVGTCNTDSGGPLIIGEGSNRTLIGIVSYNPAKSCGDERSVDVYLRVSAFTDWIKAHMDKY